jgi:hypothetical protein
VEGRGVGGTLGVDDAERTCGGITDFRGRPTGREDLEGLGLDLEGLFKGVLELAAGVEGVEGPDGPDGPEAG